MKTPKKYAGIEAIPDPFNPARMIANVPASDAETPTAFVAPFATKSFLRTINRNYLRSYQREWLFLLYGSKSGYDAWWNRPYRTAA